MAEKTPNLNLSLPSQNDPANVEVLNENFRKLDEHAMVHPDMAVNDPNDLRYIENRLAYKEEGTVVFFPTMTVSNVGLDEEWVYVAQYLRYPLVAGNTYTVTVNGESHNIVAQAVGNAVVLDGPDYYAFFSDGDDTRLRLSANTSATYGIAGEGEVVKPVDSEYLTFSGRPEIEELTDGDMVPVARPDGSVALLPAGKVGGGGGGIPPTGPYQMMVTDGDQNQLWEERTHYPYIAPVEILPEVEYENLEYDPGSTSYNVTEYMKGPIVTGKTYHITFGDEKMECLAQVEDNLGITVIADNNDFLNHRVALMYYSDGKCLLSINDGGVNTKPIVKVEGPGVKYKKLDPEKYLPEGGVGWTEEGGGGVIVEMTWPEQSDEMAVTSPPSASLKPGYTYTFDINGTQYNCVVETLTEGEITIPVAGNVAAAMGNGDTGEPFVYMDFSQVPEYEGSGMYGAVLLLAEVSFPCTLQIQSGGGMIHGIDPKYLPEGGFGYTETKQAYILPEIEFENYDYYYPGKLPSELIVGQDYRVTINGVEYVSRCRALDLMGYTIKALGDYDNTGATGDPYSFWQYPDEIVGQQGNGASFSIKDVTMPGPYIVSIEGPAEVIHPIDKKFLPEMGIKTLYAAEEDIDTTSGFNRVRVWNDSTKTSQPTFDEAVEILNNGGCLVGNNAWRYPPIGWAPNISYKDIYYMSAFRIPGSNEILDTVNLTFSDTIRN